jgi:LEA14-like dessication related protein
MNRAVNTVLVTLLAFFVFLAVLVYLTGPTAPDGAGGDDAGPEGEDIPTATSSASPSQAPTPDAVVLREVTTAWRQGAYGSADLVVGLTLANGHAAAIPVEDISYEITFNGEPVRRGNWAGAVLAAGTTSSIDGAIAFDESLTQRWWDELTFAAGRPTVRIAGDIRPAGLDAIPFAWEAQADGDLGAQLFRDARNCGGDDPVCITDERVDWFAGTVRWTLGVENTLTEDVSLFDGSVTVVLGGVEVSSAGFGDRVLAPGERAEIVVDLAFDDAIHQWWGPHALDCESSRATVRVVFMQEWQEPAPVDSDANNTEDTGNGTEPPTNRSERVDWTSTTPTFETGLVCDRGG